MSNTLPSVPNRAHAQVQNDAQETRQYLTFTLGGELFAIPILHIKEIIEFSALTEIPMMPPLLRGVLNLRGAVVPVIDLLERFGRNHTEVSKRTCIVILELDTEEGYQALGVMVDSVNEVLAVEQNRIEARPSFGTKMRADFIEGMIDFDGHFVVTLDIGQVLSFDEISQLIQVAEQHET